MTAPLSPDEQIIAKLTARLERAEAVCRAVSVHVAMPTYPDAAQFSAFPAVLASVRDWQDLVRWDDEAAIDAVQEVLEMSQRRTDDQSADDGHTQDLVDQLARQLHHVASLLDASRGHQMIPWHLKPLGYRSAIERMVRETVTRIWADDDY